jgi:hypothetical protein
MTRHDPTGSCATCVKNGNECPNAQAKPEATQLDPQALIAEHGDPIGGHLLQDKSGPAMHVHRVERGGGTQILKAPFTQEDADALGNEFDKLLVLEGSGFTPKAIAKHADGSTLQEDLGVTDEHPHDGEKFRRNMIQLLWTLRKHGIRHGDLTSANILLQDDWPWAIDFAEAHFIGEKAPQKSPMTDTHLVLRTLKDWPDDTGVADTPRVARRWGAVMRHAAGAHNLALPLRGKKLLDLGCFQGDFVALAACEGMAAYGVDAGGFRTGGNSIAEGLEIFD